VRIKIALRADRLRALREQKEWSQRELARRCGFGESQVRKYENGESDPSSTYLKIMAEQFEVSTDYLLGLTNDPRGHISDSELTEDEHAMVEAFRENSWKGVMQLLAERLTE
jgi:transcriptional regulator with XRE-family HTH domain